MTVWFLALCTGCTPYKPMPFVTPRERDDWAYAHRMATGHNVETTFEVQR